MTPVQLHWIFGRTKKWHAWPVRGEGSLCGAVTAQQVREALQKRQLEISDTPPVQTGRNLCELCRRKAGVVAETKGLSADAALWMPHLLAHGTRMRVNYPRDELEELAERLATIGPPTSLEAQTVYMQLQKLILTPLAVSVGSGRRDVKSFHLRAAVQALPPSATALRQVANALKIWSRVTGRGLVREKLSPATVLQVMLEVPQLEPYVSRLHAQGMSNLRAMFHPSTLEWARKDPTLRGMFAGTDAYWDKTADTLNVVAE